MGAYAFILKKEWEARAPFFAIKAIAIMAPNAQTAAAIAQSKKLDLSYYTLFDLLAQQGPPCIVACEPMSWPRASGGGGDQGAPRPADPNERDDSMYTELSGGLTPGAEGLPDGMPIDMPTRF